MQLRQAQPTTSNSQRHRIAVRTSSAAILALEVNKATRQLFISFNDGHHLEHQLTFNHKTLPDFIDALLELSEYLELDAAAAGQGRLL